MGRILNSKPLEGLTMIAKSRQIALMPKATTVRFTDEMFARLDQASARTGMPVNSIVIAACLEWMQRHTPGEPSGHVELPAELPRLTVPTLAAAPRRSTIPRAVEQAVAKRQPAGIHPSQPSTAQRQKQRQTPPRET